MNVSFIYELPSGDSISVEADVTPAQPARIDCLPEDATPAEDAEVDDIKTEFNGAPIDLYGLFYRKWKSTDMICIEDKIRELAIDELDNQ